MSILHFLNQSMPKPLAIILLQEQTKHQQFLKISEITIGNIIFDFSFTRKLLTNEDILL